MQIIRKQITRLKDGRISVAADGAPTVVVDSMDQWYVMYGQATAIRAGYKPYKGED